MAHRYKFGIEEEYFLADRDTGRSSARAVAEAFHNEAEKALYVAEHELLFGQIEVSTEPGTDPEDALAALRQHRRDLSRLAERHGLLLFAAGSHPLALVDDQHVAQTDRYRRLGDELKLIAPKAPVSAMHVHVEVPDPDARVDLINRLMPFLPLLLALSVSSPFWEGLASGLQGYRLTAFSQWPRAGLPNYFSTAAQYEAYVARLKAVDFVEDASMIWAHLRPSVRYPTIEMRVCDSCTRLSDAVAIAALYRALVRAVVRRPGINAGFDPVGHALCGTNLWRAQQAGIAATFVDIGSDRTLNVSQALDDALALAADDFQALGMLAWQDRLRSIMRDGTSADRQQKVYAKARQGGHHDEALQKVIGVLARETVAELSS